MGGAILAGLQRSGRTVLAILALLAASPSTPASASETVTVFAAASMQSALDAAIEAWTAETGNEAVISYAATSALARQIEQGAPADIFLSADLDWMDYLEAQGLIAESTRTNLLGNRLVLVAPTATAAALDLTADLDMAGLLGDGRLAIADTNAVPAGRYAREALESLGLWDEVADRLAPTENVRVALAFVSRGETPFGIVYATDAIADPNVEAVGQFPAWSHPPIIYPTAIVAGTGNPTAEALLAWLHAPVAQCIFAAQGFVLIATEGRDVPLDCTSG